MTAGSAPALALAAGTRIEHATEILRRNLHQPLHMTDLARECCLSRAQFYRLFREITGETPARMLRRLRMQEALRLIAGTELAVKEVAARAGFKNPGHFARAFQAAHGEIPLQYRRCGR